GERMLLVSPLSGARMSRARARRWKYLSAWTAAADLFRGHSNLWSATLTAALSFFRLRAWFGMDRTGRKPPARARIRRCRFLAERRQELAAAHSRRGGPPACRAFIGTSQSIPAITCQSKEPP